MRSRKMLWHPRQSEDAVGVGDKSYEHGHQTSEFTSERRQDPSANNSLTLLSLSLSITPTTSRSCFFVLLLS